MTRESRETAPNQDLLRVISASTAENPMVFARSFGYTVVKSALLQHVMESAEALEAAVNEDISLKGVSAIIRSRAVHAELARAQTEFAEVMDEFLGTKTKKTISPKEDSHELRDYTGIEVEERLPEPVSISGDFEVIGEGGSKMYARDLIPGDVISFRVTTPAASTTEAGSGKATLEITLVDRETAA